MVLCLAGGFSTFCIPVFLVTHIAIEGVAFSLLFDEDLFAIIRPTEVNAVRALIQLDCDICLTFSS